MTARPGLHESSSVNESCKGEREPKLMNQTSIYDGQEATLFMKSNIRIYYTTDAVQTKRRKQKAKATLDR